MPTGFQQQDPTTGFCIPKSAAIPQHGQQADKLCKKIKEKRVIEPRPPR